MHDITETLRRDFWVASGLVAAAIAPLMLFLWMAIRHENPAGVRLLLAVGVMGGLGGLYYLHRIATRGVPAVAGLREISTDRRIASFGPVRVDFDARTVHRDGDPVELTPREFDLLAALLTRRGKVCSRIMLLREVWGDIGAVTARTVDVHVAAIRKKLESAPSAPRHIRTVARVGYRLDD